jgi:hypothetical protein
MKKLLSSVGSCGFCVRQSLRAALLSLVLVFGSVVVARGSVVFYIAVAISASLFALWLLHVVVFGLRVAIRSVGAARNVEQTTRSADRRGLMLHFGKAALGMAAFTVTTVIASNAKAQNCMGGFNNIPCGQQCCNSGPGFSQHCCQTASGQTYCAQYGVPCS